MRLGLAPLLGAGLIKAVAIYLVLVPALWLLLSWLAAVFSSLDFAKARRAAARALAPLCLAPLYGITLKLNIPHLGTGLAAVLILWCLWLLIKPLWPHRRLPDLPAGFWVPLVPLAVGLGLVGAWMMHLKSTTLDTSIAQGGRGLEQVMLYSPHLGDLFQRHETDLERLVAVNPLVLVLVGLGLLILLLARRPAREGASSGSGPGAAVFAFLGLTAALLALGPGLRVAPLYALFYDWVPFFNFPRVPGRIIMVGVVLLSLFGGWALARVAGWLPRRWGPAALALLVIAVAAWHAWPRAPMAVCLIPPPGPVEERIAQEMPQGPQTDQRLLGLPIWPGDSHQSSIYELMITRTRAVSVNGYSPVVPQSYVDRVFWPLFPLDLGQVDAPALAVLRKLKVGLVDFHDDDNVYPAKISPFPPALARQRLLASGAFTPLEQAGTVFLWRFDPNAKPDPAPGRVTSPVASLWEAEWLRPATGAYVEDKEASGWGLMFEGSLDPAAPLGPRLARPAGNLIQAKAGTDKPGFLARGTGKYFPAGSYLARFRLRRGPGGDAAGSAGWAGVSLSRGGQALGRVELVPDALPPDGRWHTVDVPFRLDALAPVNLQAHFSGAADLALDVVTVCFADQAKPPEFYRAQDLWRQTGDLAADSEVPGGLAVTARPGYHPPLYLMHGPQRLYPPGRYTAAFRLAGESATQADAPAVHLAVASDLGRLTLAQRKVLARDLKPGLRRLPAGLHPSAPHHSRFPGALPGRGRPAPGRGER